MSPEEMEHRIDTLLSQMTLEEKVTLLAGRDTWATMPIERLNVPVILMTDGTHGVRANQPDSGRSYAGPTTAFPTGVSLASTWNPDLVEQAARAMGEETRGAGCDVLLAPCINIVRTPIAGRNFEAYGEDPYLAGRIGVAYVNGVQSAGVGVSLKHFAANNQEIERFRGSSEVDERTLREIYLPHFEAVVKEAKPWTVMCSYNRINGVYASQNHYLLTEILKEEWGFDGAVVSDWTANHSIFESVAGGLDLEMPGPAKYYGQLLVDAVRNWQIEESAVDEAARRVLRLIARAGKLDNTSTTGALNTPEHQALARSVAEEAITLLKNDGVLPLTAQQFQTLAVIGPGAAELSVSGGGSALVEPPYRIGPLAAIRERLGDQVEVRYEQGCDNWQEIPVLKSAYVRPAKKTAGKTNELGLYGEYFAGEGFKGKPVLERVDPRLDFFWFSSGPIQGLGPKFSARWSGKLEVPESGRYTFTVSNIGAARLFLDGKQIAATDTRGMTVADFGNARPRETTVELKKGHGYDLRFEVISAQDSPYAHARLGFALTPEVDDRLERAVAVAKEAEVALVVVGVNEMYETEGWDRPNLRLPGKQEDLIRAVAAANPRTIVVLNVGGPVEMPWLYQVAAVLQAYLPGQEGGAALAGVLTGEVNPSGRLVATYPRRLEDTPSFTNLSYPGARQVRYGEGIFVGYRYYDHANVEPLFPFGHGLSYTTFEYANLSVPAKVTAGEPVEVSVSVTNTGARPGKEVVQLYVRDVESSLARPPKELKGFQKVALEPGETKTLRFNLDRRALAFYDVLKADWVVEPGAFEVLVGASAGDIRVSKRFEVV